MVIDYLKRLTFLSKEEIEAIEKEHLEAPERRVAQKTLAKEIISDLHGEQAFEEAVQISQQLFAGDIKSIDPKNLLAGLKNVPHCTVAPGKLADVLVGGKICSSKREAYEFLNNGAISVNGDIVKDKEYMINKDSVFADDFVIIRRGKKKYYVVTITE